MAEMLIDRYLPTFDTTVIEHTVVDADMPVTWSALEVAGRATTRRAPAPPNSPRSLGRPA